MALTMSEGPPSYLDAQNQHCGLKEKILNRNPVLEPLLQNLKELSLCIKSQGGDSKKSPRKCLTQHPHHTKSLAPDYDSLIPIEHWQVSQTHNLSGQWFATRQFPRGSECFSFQPEVKMLRNVFSDISSTIKLNDMKFGVEMQLRDRYRLQLWSQWNSLQW